MSAHMALSVDFNEVHNMSVEILHNISESEHEMGVGLVALLLSAGRLISPRLPMSDEEEIHWIKASVDFAGSYFAGGSSN